MISIINAIQLINNQAKQLKTEECALLEAAGSVIATDFTASYDHPAFRQSAMDGYAFSANTNTDKAYTVAGESRAGHPYNGQIVDGSCIRVFTGAALPDNTATVVPQEEIIQEGENIRLSHKPATGVHIKEKGSHFKTGEILIPKGTKLGPTEIAMLAMCGQAKVYIYRKPVIGMITTGDELVPPGKVLKQGQIYESNSLMLHALIQQYGFSIKHLAHSPDSTEELQSTFAGLEDSCDLILFSGGISVGKYDPVRILTENKTIKSLFYKIAQKPGKPIFTGITEKETWIMALPGNPGAALTCAWMYLLPLLNQLSGLNISQLPADKKTLLQPYSKKAGIAHLLKGFSSHEGVRILPDQESYKITSFAQANCLIHVPEETIQLTPGEQVEVFHLHL